MAERHNARPLGLRCPSPPGSVMLTPGGPTTRQAVLTSVPCVPLADRFALCPSLSLGDERGGE